MGYLPLAAGTWDSLVERVAGSAAPVRWSWAALRQPDDTWDLVVLSVRASRRVRRTLLSYPNITLFAEQVAPATAADRLRQGVACDGRDGKPQLSFPVPTSTMNPVWRTTEPDQTWYSRSGWPEYYVWYDLQSRPDRRTNLSNVNQLVVAGQPVFVDALSAVAEFIYEEPRERIGNDSGTRIVVTLPDARGRFDRVSFHSDEVRLGLKGRALRGCHVRAAWRFSGRVNWERSDLVIDNQRHVAVRTGQLPGEMTVYLCNPEGEILDRREWDERHGERPADARAPRDQVDELLLAGEGDQLEYKQKLGEEKVNLSFARTVSAFANGAGGRILVGVAQDASVVGWGPEDGSDQIAAIIRDNVKVLPSFKSHRVTTGRKPIFLVDVQPGGSKPYLCRDICYVRVQATTRKAEPNEIAGFAAPPPTLGDPLDRFLRM